MAWWPLVALTVLAAVLRFSTLDLQSFWYDEAFTPVHVLRGDLGATLSAVVAHENTPPLWYVVVWAWSRLFGLGMVALRFPSALAGVATVPVAWGIGRELAWGGRREQRVALATAAIVAVNPLFVWYSQEARAYAFFVFFAAAAVWCFLRARREPSGRRLAAFALSGAVALLTHYFAVFLLVPMCLLLLADRGRWRRVLPAVGAIVVVGLALVPLVAAQGGHGTQWISAWALDSRIATIPQYFLTGYSGAPLGHAIELAVALVIGAGVGFGLVRGLTGGERRGALVALALVAGGVGIPVVLALCGADYLAPRNVVAAMVPLSGMIAVIAVSERAGRVGMAVVAVLVVAFVALSVDVNLSPRLQRSDWRGVARELADHVVANGGRVITTVELASAPLEYYLPPLRNAYAGQSVTVREIDETGYAPLRRGAGMAPVRGFVAAGRLEAHGLIIYRFVSALPRKVSVERLLREVITDGRAEVLVPGRGSVGALAP